MFLEQSTELEICLTTTTEYGRYQRSMISINLLGYVLLKSVKHCLIRYFTDPPYDTLLLCIMEIIFLF